MDGAGLPSRARGSGSTDIAEFLTTRRARITPEQAGLPTYGKRRVPGLRREEVASLAGMSVEYYKRLERGNVSGVSELVLEALAHALQLDDAERAHLFDLARAAKPVAVYIARRGRSSSVSGRSCSSILDQIAAPALVAQRPARPRRRQRARPRPLRADVRQPRAAGQQRPLHLPGPRRRRLLSRLGARGDRARRPPALRGRRATRTTAALRPRRRAVDPQRGVPRPLGGAQRALPPAPAPSASTTRSSATSSSATRRMELSADDGLRVAVFTAEPGSAVAAGARPARQLDGDSGDRGRRRHASPTRQIN